MMQQASFVLRLLLGLIFATSAIGKMRKPRLFVETVEQVAAMFGVRWRRSAAGVAIAVIAFEVALAIVLLAGLIPVPAAIASIVLFASFAALAGVAALRGAKIECHCFGASSDTLGFRTSARALLLTFAAVAYLVAALASGAGVVPASLEEWVSAATTVVGGAVLFAWASTIDVPIRLVLERRSEAGNGAIREALANAAFAAKREKEA